MMDEFERAEKANLLKGKRILVVGDESVSKSLFEMLAAIGSVVETAHLGADAIALVTEVAGSAQAYDLILSPISLADMNGYDLLIQLKAKLSRVPLIMMTDFGYDRTVWFAKAFHAGLHRKGVLFMPARLDHLLRAATAVMSE